MKHIVVVLAVAVLLVNCKSTKKIDGESLSKKFKEHADKIQKVEYSVHRIDTFPKGGIVWDNYGTAFIQKDKTDKIFGFSFIGKRNDIPTEYMYDNGVGFEIDKTAKTYKTFKCNNVGFIGSPGGQMILQNIFYLDSVFKSRTVSESDSHFIIKYEFENDTVYNVKENVKIVELDKHNYFPVKVTRSSKVLGNTSYSQVTLSNVKINDEVENSIQAFKQELKDYELVQPERRGSNPILQKKLPPISLPDLLNKSTLMNVTIDQVTLIDFWETWCGPCVASIPKVESLHKKYGSQLKVIGILTEDDKAALKLIQNKGATFLNLIGNKQLVREFGIDSWPRYFLVDKNGIIRKEYFGFSDKIESDIKELID